MGRIFEKRKATIFKTAAQRSKLYSKYGKQLYMVAKNGVPDPDANPVLRTLVERAKRENVPSHVIEKAIQKSDLGLTPNTDGQIIRRYQPDVVTTYNDFGGYGHPDHIRTHDVTVRAFARAGDAAWYPEQLSPEHGGTGPAAGEGGLAPWSPDKLYEQAIPESTRKAMRERLEALGKPSFWSPPEDATPEQLAEFEAYMAKMLVPDETITTWIDISGEPIDRKWAAIQEHVTQIAPDSTFMLFGLDGWREAWAREAFILRESTVETGRPVETRPPEARP